MVIGSETLPDDWTLDQSEFLLIRDFSSNSRLSSVEKKYEEVRGATMAGDDARAAKAVSELREDIGTADNKNEAAELYAGYLLGDLDNTPGKARFTDIVDRYRAQEARSLHPLIMKGIHDKKFSWATPFAVSEMDDLFKVKDLGSYSIERQPGTGGEPGYLRIWRGRSLIIVAEKPGAPYSFDSSKGGLTAYLTNNPSLGEEAKVQTIKLPYRN